MDKWIVLIVDMCITVLQNLLTGLRWRLWVGGMVDIPNMFWWQSDDKGMLFTGNTLFVDGVMSVLTAWTFISWNRGLRRLPLFLLSLLGFNFRNFLGCFTWRCGPVGGGRFGSDNLKGPTGGAVLKWPVCCSFESWKYASASACSWWDFAFASASTTSYSWLLMFFNIVFVSKLLELSPEVTSFNLLLAKSSAC